MKILFTIFILISSAYAEGEKIYNQEEFDIAVNKKLKKYSNSGLIELSRELMKKEKEIALIEMNIKKREEALEMTNKDLGNRLKEFQKSQNKFLACIDKNDQDQKKRVSHMVSVVSGMRPKTAAEVLSVQDATIAVKILGRLKAEKVSKIFNSMDKAVSARLQKQYMSMKR
jgi:flagellar motility protein MotE (MotC chaperone)